MREGRPSFTAAAVAAARGIGNVDPVAAELLPAIARPIVRAAAHRSALSRALNVASLGLVDHVTLRTAAIDAAVADAFEVERGVRQLVILGAGLDARAYRMDALRDATVFEVDHPWTQAYKQAHVGSRVPRAREVRLVAVDFEKDSLDAELARAGHDPAAPTFWIWEGVTPYLPLGAIRASLATVAARSADRSRLAVTYVTPEATTLSSPLAKIALQGLRAIGEPVLGQLPSSAMKRELAAVGFVVKGDTSPRDWAERFGGGERRILVVVERLALATKSPRS